MKISIVDTSPVLAGSTAVEAFRTRVELAQLADQAGFLRYWLSEVHGVLTNAGTTPEVAVAAVVSRTSSLRVGSGGILVNHRSPYRVAETFLQLHVIDGCAGVGAEGAALRQGQAGWLDRPAEDGLAMLPIVSAEGGARLILYAGQPQLEPIVVYGPFIGDSGDDIVRLYNDYRQDRSQRVSHFSRAGSRD
jgi:Luciferase-like monooxygenase/Pirin C-terminal cupin domain